MRGLLDLVFPPRCAGCDLPGAPLCAGCAAQVARIDPARSCVRCGAPEGQTGCSACHGRTFAFSAARCGALLQPPVSRAVVVLKDGGERRYAPMLAALLAEAAEGWLEDGDVLVPVPASPRAVRRRGFDHAADLALELGWTVELPVARLLQARPAADQRGLGRQDRFANRASAFGLRPDAAVPERIVLVDDVLTTGATLDAAASVLLQAGVAEVRALAVALAL